MSNSSLSKYNVLLRPFSVLYGMGVGFRNQLFDMGILKSTSYPVPVICVGNLTVGGTGKTPHIEYLIRLLSGQYKVAVVSRGYKRTTEGFILATQKSTAREIGDEPFQIKRKFPNIIVAVDANRRNAIEKLLALADKDRPEVILLDDAYQHRYVKPSFTILLSDYNRMFYDDTLLPAGRLRESADEKTRADMVIVTKTPADLKPIGYRIVENNMELQAHQLVFFSYIGYDNIRPLLSGQKKGEVSVALSADYEVLLVSGIASPQPFIAEVEKSGCKVHELIFADHHDFTVHDIQHIDSAFKKLKGKKKIILTTEKDASRLKNNTSLSADLKRNIYYWPIHIDFSAEHKEEFDNIILKHIRNFHSE